MPSIDQVSDLNSWPIEIPMIGEGDTRFCQPCQKKPARRPWLPFRANDRRTIRTQPARSRRNDGRVFANIDSGMLRRVEHGHFA